MKHFSKWTLLIASACMLWSCHNHTQQNEATDVGHQHEEHKGHIHNTPLLLTAYNETLECFAETSPFVLNKEVTLNTHLTQLANFKPLKDAEVSAILTVNDKIVRSTKTELTRKGIYKITLLPNEIGEGVITFNIQLIDKELQTIAIPTVVFDCQHEAHEYAESLEQKSSNAAAFTKEKSWFVDFATAPISVEKFGKIIPAVGAIQPAQGAQRILTAKANGVVNFARLALTEGQNVTANQTLFTLDGGSMADNNIGVKYKTAEAEYIQAKFEYIRKQKLVEQKIVSRSELLKAKTDFINAESIYENLKQNFSNKGQRIFTPFSGYISHMYVKDGEFVTTGQAIISIAQNSDLYIKAQLSSRYYSYLQSVKDVTFKFNNDAKVYKLKDLNGEVLSYSHTTTINDPLLTVSFKINNPKHLLAGGFVNIKIQSEDNEEHMIVPNTALIEELGNFFVYVQLTPEYFEKRLVNIGDTNGKQTVVFSGLTKEERIVSRGAILVKLAQATGSVDPHAGHNH